MKDTFLKNEFWMLSVQGAFQRAGVYESNILENEFIRHAFRKGLRDYIENDLLEEYKFGVTEKKHLLNIQAFKSHAEIIGNGILKDNTFKYGIAQKLLNLYLKYLWVSGEIVEPVHFPVDARIQKALNMGKDFYPWTKMTTEEEYMKVINKANSIIIGTDLNWKGKFPEEIKSIAELELYLFSVETDY